MEHAIRLLGVAHGAHGCVAHGCVAHGCVAHGAPQNALYGFDVILPVKSLRSLMFQARAGSTTCRARVEHVACWC
jgi:hypothetical protein